MPLTRASYIIGTHGYFARKDATALATVTTSSRQRTSNVATIVTANAHGFWTGAVVTITGLSGAGYNQAGVVVTVINATNFSYSNTGSDEALTADTGGTVTLSGTVSSSFRPGPNDPAWESLGVIEDASVSRQGNKIPIWAPSPGKIVKHDSLTNKHELMLKLTSQEWGPFAEEVLYLTEPLTEASTQFNPLEGDDKKGWLKCQRYDQDDDLREVIDLWGLLTIAGDIQFGGSDIVKPAFEFEVFHSSLNTGKL